VFSLYRVCSLDIECVLSLSVGRERVDHGGVAAEDAEPDALLRGGTGLGARS